MLRTNSLLLLFVLLHSCVGTDKRMEEKYRITYHKETVLRDFLRKSATDTLQDWIDADLDYTSEMRFNNWKVDSLFVLNQARTRAIGFTTTFVHGHSGKAYIQPLYCEKRNGQWYFFDGLATDSTKENDQTNLNVALSFEQLSKVGRKQLLHKYYGHIWLFPYFFWTKGKIFADPFWGSETQKEKYIQRKERKKEHIEGLELYQNEPNPFSTTTKIKTYIPDNITDIELEIFNLTGEKVGSKIITERGKVSIIINAEDYAPGEYRYTLLSKTAKKRSSVQGFRKMIVRHYLPVP
jgi:hypothetical protein